jgi:hypothetical protein
MAGSATPKLSRLSFVINIVHTLIFAQMILDKKFLGILDQETGVLVVFSKEVRDTTYDDVNETVTAMNKARFFIFLAN